MSAEMVREHTNCRVCGQILDPPFLDLGMQPLANALRRPDDDSAEFMAPLEVARCMHCGLAQLTVVVAPELLYTGYRFRSGVSEGWRAHCRDLAWRAGDGHGKRALDIGANDGAMIQALIDAGWTSVSGVDPAPSPDSTRIAAGYWSERYAEGLTAIGLYDLVTAQNVFGHVDDPMDFLRGVKLVLADEGRCAIEVPHFGDLIAHTAFDTIYHEHLSYWSLRPMMRAVHSAGLQIVQVDRLASMHGGSRRYWLMHGGHAMESSVYHEIDVEYRQHLYADRPLEEFAERVRCTMDNVELMLDTEYGTAGWRAPAAPIPCMGWGASAKGAVALNAAAARGYDMHVFMTAVIDETEAKQGLEMPGVRVPIIAPPEDLSDVDLIWILVWNWAEQVKTKARARGFRGKFLVTAPMVRIEST
jgi:SAM-dependent methyltransferase